MFWSFFQQYTYYRLISCSRNFLFPMAFPCTEPMEIPDIDSSPVHGLSLIAFIISKPSIMLGF